MHDPIYDLASTAHAHNNASCALLSQFRAKLVSLIDLIDRSQNQRIASGQAVDSILGLTSDREPLFPAEEDLLAELVCAR